MSTAISAIRAGAYDFITKPFDLELLEFTLKKAIRLRHLKEQVRVLGSGVGLGNFGEIIGYSSSMQKLFNIVKQLANSDAPVLVSGESGVGKELVAKALHLNSKRKHNPFVAVNCAAIPDSLLESELFGYHKGSFTDAKTSHKGLIEQANKGTLFLDEIADLAIKLQPKLLRSLEEGKIRPLGSEREIDVDIRLVTATNKNLESEISVGRFREDLFFRINVVQLDIPPLRSRLSDLPELSQHFITRFNPENKKSVGGLSSHALEMLLNYNWPGNVRELRNVIERAVALTQTDKIIVEDLPHKIQSYQNDDLIFESGNPEALLTLEEFERRYIIHASKALRGNKTAISKTLGLDRKTLYRKLKKFNAPLLLYLPFK